MLTLPEQLLFILALFASASAAYISGKRIVLTIRRGQGSVDWELVKRRLGTTIYKTITFQPVFRFRFWPSLFHGLVAWGFIYYLLVNLIDVLAGFIDGLHLPGAIGDIYRLIADLLTVGVLTGMIALIIRRFILKPATLTTRADILLHPKARFGIRRDSAIVSGFILVHVGSRFLESHLQLLPKALIPGSPLRMHSLDCGQAGANPP